VEEPPRHHLAQLNIALLRAPLDTPLLADFVASLEPINALADKSLGFVWRLQTEEGHATSIRGFDNDAIIVNLSVWESIETLFDFTYRGAHIELLRRRREWFQRMAEAHQCLWWIPAGHIPTVAEAEERLRHLQRHGPSSTAFTFRVRFPAGGIAR
jgi:hypothetical protein